VLSKTHENGDLLETLQNEERRMTSGGKAGYLGGIPELVPYAIVVVDGKGSEVRSTCRMVRNVVSISDDRISESREVMDRVAGRWAVRSTV
jgi:hypothetical protein